MNRRPTDPRAAVRTFVSLHFERLTPKVGWSLCLLFALALPGARHCLAETATPLASPLTLSEAVSYALAHQPALSAQDAIEQQAVAGVETARAGYVQQLDVSESVNWAQAAHNPVGLYLPLPGFPVFEGPRSNGSFGGGALNGATSVVASEDIVALIRQMSVVDAALALHSQQAAATDEQRMLIAFGAAQTFMNELAAIQTVKAARAGVMRDQAFVTSVKGLVDSGLRPGADLARAQAELATTRNLELQAEQNQQVAYAALAQALGAIDLPRVEISDSQLLKPPLRNALPAGPSPSDPLVREASAGVNSTIHFERAAQLEYLPRFNVIAGLFGRGSGFGYGGSPVSAGGGSLPSSYNFTAGVALTIPIEQILAARADVDRARANVKLAKSQYQETALQLRTQFDSALAVLTSAVRIASNTTIELDAAQASQRQNLARYRPGLATALDVETANQFLTQAEIDHSVAYVNVCLVFLVVRRAAVELRPFWAPCRQAEPGSR